jgi:hypothetical protein
MRLSDEVRTFASAAEWILSTIAITKPLTREDASTIEKYCLQLLVKIRPLLQKPD